jgi:hypothetical protein
MENDAIATGATFTSELSSRVFMHFRARRGYYRTMQDHVTNPDSPGRTDSAASDINSEPRMRASVADYKGSTLLEADPSTNYERAASDFVKQMMSTGRTVFVVTSKRSPIYILLRENPNIHFYVFSDVTYPRESGTSLEVLVPNNDRSALLNVLDGAVSKPAATQKAIVFDNISSMILDAGFQETYKFLREMNEIVTHGDVTSISIILSKAHDDKTMNLIRTLFSGHLTYDAAGLHVTK